jgi:hypothetical protein
VAESCAEKLDIGLFVEKAGSDLLNRRRKPTLRALEVFDSTPQRRGADAKHERRLGGRQQGI